MSELKCPFCQQKLVRHWGMEEPALYCCDNPKCSRGGVATESAWQELIRTSKALDVAVEGLEKMTWGCDSSDAEHLLKEIKGITVMVG